MNDKVWCKYDLTNLTSGDELSGTNFEYEWGGLIGGDPPNGEYCNADNNLCGRVFLEHIIDVSGRSYDYAPQF